MNLSELTTLFDSLLINSVTDDIIIKKIINSMFEASELGINDLKYYFQNTSNINNIIHNLQEYFPDINISHPPNTNYIYIDWS